MVRASRWTTWRTLVSPTSLLPWSPALRKYLETTMSVASWDQPFGISAPSILKTTDPSGFVMTLGRRSHVAASRGATPRSVNLRSNETPRPRAPFFAGPTAFFDAEAGCVGADV